MNRAERETCRTGGKKPRVVRSKGRKKERTTEEGLKIDELDVKRSEKKRRRKERKQKEKRTGE